MTYKFCYLNRTVSDAFEGWLSDNNVSYKATECGDTVHFACLMDDEQTEKASAFIALL